MSLIAPIANISRGSLHDGPGVRTVIYFKGCSLRCVWCHNPETILQKPQILYINSKCIHCGRCVEVCPGHHIIQGEDMCFVREGCTACGKCAEICPSLALNVCGENKGTAELFEEIKKDMHYYAASGGGVTFSGGECLLYPDFLVELSQMCLSEKIHTVVETALFVPWDNIARVIPFTDLFYADMKIADREKHKVYTGQYNDLIIENIRKLSVCHKNIILRIPVICGVNDSEEDIRAFSEIINTFGDGIKGIELLRYNNLAKSKYDFVGREYVSFSDTPQTDEQMKEICLRFERYGIKVNYS